MDLDLSPEALLAATLPIDHLILPAHAKFCTGCKSAPPSAGYVTCARCREKRAAASRRATERKRAARMQLASANIANIKANWEHDALLTPPTKGKGKEKEKESTGKKRKEPPTETAADALERIRKRFKTMDPYTPTTTTSASGSSTKKSAPDVQFHKFAAAAELHKDLRKRFPSPSSSSGGEATTFHATYAIIADPAVDNEERTRVVARDLKGNTGLQFDPESKLMTDRRPHAHRVTYKCLCGAAPLKRSGSDIASYFASSGSSKSKSKSISKPEKKSDEAAALSQCHGSVEISAEDDRSHPLGWLGQRVKVSITHPKIAT
ncbi:hypothetical protein C8R46DRAFT_1342980 [Mycena filopes]|nr:hypothetical protein C8R46DRAFT_1342980 [Mycena filopes]